MVSKKFVLHQSDLAQTVDIYDKQESRIREEGSIIDIGMYVALLDSSVAL